MTTLGYPGSIWNMADRSLSTLQVPLRDILLLIVPPLLAPKSAVLNPPPAWVPPVSLPRVWIFAIRPMHAALGSRVPKRLPWSKTCVTWHEGGACHGWMDGWMDGWVDRWMDGWSIVNGFVFERTRREGGEKKTAFLPCVFPKSCSFSQFWDFWKIGVPMVSQVSHMKFPTIKHHPPSTTMTNHEPASIISRQPSSMISNINHEQPWATISNH